MDFTKEIFQILKSYYSKNNEKINEYKENLNLFFVSSKKFDLQIGITSNNSISNFTVYYKNFKIFDCSALCHFSEKAAYCFQLDMFFEFIKKFDISNITFPVLNDQLLYLLKIIKKDSIKCNWLNNKTNESCQNFTYNGYYCHLHDKLKNGKFMIQLTRKLGECEFINLNSQVKCKMMVKDNQKYCSQHLSYVKQYNQYHNF